MPTGFGGPAADGHLWRPIFCRRSFPVLADAAPIVAFGGALGLALLIGDLPRIQHRVHGIVLDNLAPAHELGAVASLRLKPFQSHAVVPFQAWSQIIFLSAVDALVTSLAMSTLSSSQHSLRK